MADEYIGRPQVTVPLGVVENSRLRLLFNLTILHDGNQGVAFVALDRGTLATIHGALSDADMAALREVVRQYDSNMQNARSVTFRWGGDDG